MRASSPVAGKDGMLFLSGESLAARPRRRLLLGRLFLPSVSDQTERFHLSRTLFSRSISSCLRTLGLLHRILAPEVKIQHFIQSALKANALLAFQRRKG